jgi:sortase A
MTLGRTCLYALSWFLLAGGATGIGIYAWSELDRYSYQQSNAVYFPQEPLPVVVATTQPELPARVLRPLFTAPPKPPDPLLIGRMIIPRIDLSVLIREGIDPKTLRRAVGHLPDTALPGQPGNCVVAGHRDTFFRKLRNLESGDQIRVVTAAGQFHYRVDRLMVVEPDFMAALEPTSDPTVTLVTCFPFRYVGSAPRRFIVRGVQQP